MTSGMPAACLTLADVGLEAGSEVIAQVRDKTGQDIPRVLGSGERKLSAVPVSTGAVHMASEDQLPVRYAVSVDKTTATTRMLTRTPVLKIRSLQSLSPLSYPRARGQGARTLLTLWVIHALKQQLAQDNQMEKATHAGKHPCALAWRWEDKADNLVAGRFRVLGMWEMRGDVIRGEGGGGGREESRFAAAHVSGHMVINEHAIGCPSGPDRSDAIREHRIPVRLGAGGESTEEAKSSPPFQHWWTNQYYHFGQLGTRLGQIQPVSPTYRNLGKLAILALGDAKFPPDFRRRFFPDAWKLPVWSVCGADGGLQAQACAKRGLGYGEEALGEGGRWWEVVLEQDSLPNGHGCQYGGRRGTGAVWTWGGTGARRDGTGVRNGAVARWVRVCDAWGRTLGSEQIGANGGARQRGRQSMGRRERWEEGAAAAWRQDGTWGGPGRDGWRTVRGHNSGIHVHRVGAAGRRNGMGVAA
ncbi:hypothetical protein FB45DRAFT_1117400 [Roridomyces roridus]|uniref:Uncharacterized protein n=1 Tax=Roridomyces roridus TaxID=1738132 RepID=A0AAD7B7V3_9AGAR|nr:hypothetical protein FB45DRAFT_1117400 [Roridomyces roridus]